MEDVKVAEPVEVSTPATDHELLLQIAENTAVMRAVLEALGSALEGIAGMLGGGGGLPFGLAPGPDGASSGGLFGGD